MGPGVHLVRRHRPERLVTRRWWLVFGVYCCGASAGYLCAEGSWLLVVPAVVGTVLTAWAVES